MSGFQPTTSEEAVPNPRSSAGLSALRAAAASPYQRPIGGLQASAFRGSPLSVAPEGMAQSASENPASPAGSARAAEAARSAPMVPAFGASEPGGSSPVRVALTPPLPGETANHHTLSGTVLPNTGGGETLIRTPLGTLSTPKLALPPGAGLELELLQVSSPPTGTASRSAATGLPLLGAGGWPALDEILQALETGNPALSAQLRGDLQPVPGPRLAAAMLLFIAGLRGAVGNWPGDAVTHALERTGRGDLVRQLSDDMGELARLTENPTTGDWRVYGLPMMTPQGIMPVRLFVKRRSSKDEDEAAKRQNSEDSRFVVEVETTRLGPLQFDGLVKGRRFDLILRSTRPIAPELRLGIGQVFENAVASAGLTGGLAYSTAARFPVNPLENLARPVGIDA
jgi:hypothetical protein